MTSEELHSLILAGEGQLLEFKRSGTAHLGREICAFANSLGGRILIGVSDSGEIVPPANTNSLKSDVQSTARNIEPPLLLEMEVVDGILVIKVPASRNKPHSSSGKFYLREGATCQQMNREEIREFFYREGLVYFDEKPNERFLMEADFDQEAYDRFVDVCRITPSLERKQLLRNLGLAKEGHMTYAGSLLFCRSSARVVPGSSINCCLFQGGTTTRILDQKIHEADFLSNYDSAVNYMLAHLNTAYDIGFAREEKLELPEGALREALLNAMGHRDYRKPGDLQVHVFHDRVDIVNPGGLVGGLTLETLGTRSIPRNPLLFGTMHRMSLVERVGSGLRRIRDMCRDHPCPSPEIQADADWFRISFPRTRVDSRAGKDRSAAKPTQSPTQSSDPVSRLLARLANESRSSGELRELLGIRHRPTFRRNYLHPALEQGLIEMTIPDKPSSSRQRYRLTPEGRTVLEGLDHE